MKWCWHSWFVFKENDLGSDDVKRTYTIERKIKICRKCGQKRVKEFWNPKY